MPRVRTHGDRRTLEFQPGDIQSEMLLSQPDALVLDYARAMMCFALFVPAPRHIVMAGLGGGSLAKFCYRHFPHTRITVLEISAEVIALREAFCVPPDDARLRIVHADAADYLREAPASCDVILVDGFDAAGMPAALGSAAFYADCRRALRAGGVLAANLLSYDPCHDAMVERIGSAFRGRVCDFPGIAGNNHLLFAVRAGAGDTGLAARRQEGFARRGGLRFGFLNRLLARALVAWLAWRPV
ncbi:fused MFS/spermidine synthase [Massilia suwonensis]|uniref:Fused MFS/spermidine synthase n=1 Tax=Massilia suwonensis TaxID=648895 RepID=A0ABW0MUK1_9BURK